MRVTVIAIIDDEILALRGTESAVREALPQAEIHSFTKHGELTDFAEKEHIDIAFLDINMRGITGLELAEKLEKINPRINIIFVTGFDEYKSEAMDLHASGYLMKPVFSDDILKEIKYLRFPVIEKSRIEVRCFGNFAVFFNGAPVRFKYSKTLELFAYLIDRQGAMVTNNELSAALWEDDTHTNYLRQLCMDLKQTFAGSGFSDVIYSDRGKLGVDVSKISCDYYDYINKVQGSGDLFRGEYMSQYSWAEETLANLTMK